MKSIGDNIKSIREERNISKSELARLINVSAAYITMIENGKKKNPSLELLNKIAETLDVSFYDLLGFDEDEIKNVELELNNSKLNIELLKSTYEEYLSTFFESYLDKLMMSTYGYKINLTDEQINNLMKISNNSLLPALELLNSK